MENSLNNQLRRMEFLMEYTSDDTNPSAEKKEELPFRINRVGGNKLKVQSIETGNSIEIPFDKIEEFISKIGEFKKI